MRAVHPDSTLTYTRDGEIYVLEGALDHLADLKPFLAAQAPLRMDWRGIQSVSSAGIRLWVEFLARWGDRPMEIVGVTPPLVSMLNSVPNSVGPGGKKETIRSVLVPHSCELCNHYQETELHCRNLIDEGGDLVIPDVPCEDCGRPAHLIVEPDEYFLFLVWKSGL